MAMALGDGDLARAEKEAEPWSPLVAERIQARATMELDPASLPGGFDPDTDPYGSLAYAEARLAAGDAPGATQVASTVLIAHPWQAEGWDLLARAHRAQGSEQEAIAAERQRDWADPRWVR